ncbi:acyltransferase family protein [Rhizobium tropici]|uniref:Acyltransferase n=1 Tax=Rhizobium tropici TaxID=398 RepID=A0A329YFP3_RHITR|nr:acyltransferase family protein [Rhizobium tropici]RAX42387.1 acyltransferase [Rhizobium tropici]
MSGRATACLKDRISDQPVVALKNHPEERYEIRNCVAKSKKFDQRDCALKGSSRLSNLQYRPDIDGLRAIAVSSVVLYHAFPSLVGGGFIGVDIFFVISGYLITTILMKEIAGPGFSVLDFYERRARRIFPALAVVLLATIAFGKLVLFPNEMEELAKHAIGASFFAANFTLLNEAGYFDTESIYKPLLHTWSLAIEEQFYIFWPIVCVAMYRLRLGILFFTILILGSFAYSVFELPRDQAMAFYSPISRFWELAAGGALAFLHQRRNGRFSRPHPFGGVYSVSAAIILVLGLAFIRENQFPGAAALAPVLAAVLFIQSGQTALLNRTFLSAKPIVWVGRISYSLYLWHWPIISYLHIVSDVEPSIWTRLAAIGAAFALAAATFYFVEQPFRRRTGNAKPAITATTCLAAAASIAIFQLDLRQSAFAGVPNDNKTFLQVVEAMRSPCPFKVGSYTDCYDFTGGREPKAILLGDSHAGQLLPGLAQSSSIAPIQAFILNGGCPPLLGVERLAGGRPLDPYGDSGAKCSEINNARIGYAAASKASVVILAFVATEYNSNESHYENGADKYSYNGRNGGNLNVATLALADTVARLISAGKKVLLVGDNPTLTLANYRTCLLPTRPIKIGWTAENLSCTVDVDEAREQRASMMSEFSSLRDRYRDRVFIFDSQDHLCDNNGCPVQKDGQVFYRDRDHLSLTAGVIVGKALAKRIGYTLLK